MQRVAVVAGGVVSAVEPGKIIHSAQSGGMNNESVLRGAIAAAPSESAVNLCGGLTDFELRLRLKAVFDEQRRRLLSKASVLTEMLAVLARERELETADIEEMRALGRTIGYYVDLDLGEAS